MKIGFETHPEFESILNILNLNNKDVLHRMPFKTGRNFIRCYYQNYYCGTVIILYTRKFFLFFDVPKAVCTHLRA